MIKCILTAHIITLATTCASLVKRALWEFLILPLRAILVFSVRFKDFQNSEMVDENAIRVPTFYAPTEGYGFIRVRIIAMIVAMLFGGIHCAGWNFPFPSHAELIIWRVSSLITVIVPYTFAPSLVAALAGIDTLDTPVFWVLMPGIGLYVLARLTLLVEALTALRHLPPGAYAVVEWTALLLHL